MGSVPQHIGVRLDENTRTELQKYMQLNNMTLSQALRMLLALALRDETTNPELAFRAAAFREGLVLGVAQVREKLSEALALISPP